MKCDELEKQRYAPAIMQNGAGQCMVVMSENSKGMWLHYGYVMEVIAELKHQVWEADERAIDAGATSHEKMQESEAKNHALFLARSERNKFLASVTHCQGSMNWKNEKLAEKLFVRAGKLLKASETCKAYAEKFK